MEDLKLRDRLEALADEVSPQTAMPRGLTTRAHRRAALVIGATVACMVVVSIAFTVGVRAVLRSEPVRPAIPSPTPPPSGAEGLITVVPIEGALPTGAVVVDLEGGVGAADSLRIGRSGLPLAWSPDGQRLLFSLPTGGVFVREPDGTVGQLAATGGFWGASWSPDGSQIVFGKALGGRTSLHVIDADGTGERMLLDAGANERFLYPTWSPTGTRIAFLRTTGLVPAADRPGCDARCQREGDGSAELWFMRVDGSDLRPVIADGSVHPRAFSYNPPAWSPDGLHLAFAAYVGSGQGDIQILISDQIGTHRQITTGPGDALAPAWSPGGVRIAFIREVAGMHDLRVAFRDGSEERSMRSLAVPAVYAASPVLWNESPMA